MVDRFKKLLQNIQKWSKGDATIIEMKMDATVKKLFNYPSLRNLFNFD